MKTLAALAPLISPHSSTAVTVGEPIAQDYDPFQALNRASFSFSTGVDHVLIGPIAHGYMRIAPRVVRNRLSSAVFNLGEPGTALNDLVQGHPAKAIGTSSRFAINSTVGLLGLFDVASGFGIQSHSADFGQTLGRYGLVTGPYLYIPILGPLDLRDGIGRVVDTLTDPVSLVAGRGWTSPFGASRLVASSLDRRVRADGAYKALDDATDPYVSARSGYLQYRAGVIRQSTGEIQALPDFETAPPTPDGAAAAKPGDQPSPSTGKPE